MHLKDSNMALCRSCLILHFATKADGGEKIKANAQKTNHCIPLEQIGLDDLPKVGGKTASLGETIQELSPLGVDVPGGFGVSSTACDAVMDHVRP